MELSFRGKHTDWWEQNSPSKAVPPTAEGFDVVSAVSELCAGRTLDYGCGFGRFAIGFSPDEYIGVDVSESSLKIARISHPNHEFRSIPTEVSADTILLYTVLLHIDDDEIEDFLSQLDAPRIVIGEIMGRHWRAPGAYNREVSDYEKLFPNYSMTEHRFPYARYPSAMLSVLVFDE